MNHSMSTIEGQWQDMLDIETKIRDLTMTKQDLHRGIIQMLVDNNMTHCLTIKSGALRRELRFK
jgi:hypothetical protein